MSAAFSGTAIILACFFTNNDKATENYVASQMHTKAAEHQYQDKLQEERRASLTGSMTERDREIAQQQKF